MKSLIVGGTRNLGPDLVDALRAHGAHVTVLNRGQTADSLPRDVERLRADRSDAAAMRAALGNRSFDVVVDTTLYNGPDARAIAELLDGRVGRYVFWSTGQVYLVRQSAIGNRQSGFVEDDYDGPILPEPDGEYDRGQWKYGVDKREAEDALRDAHAKRGFPCVSLRMPMINSRRDHYGRLVSYAAAIRSGDTIVVPAEQGLLRHVYGDDVVIATLRAADRSVVSGTVLNVSQDEALRIDQMLGLVADALGKPLRLQRVAQPATRGPWSGTWMSVIDNARSKEVLGMRYTPPSVYIPRLLA